MIDFVVSHQVYVKFFEDTQVMMGASCWCEKGNLHCCDNIGEKLLY